MISRRSLLLGALSTAGVGAFYAAKGSAPAAHDAGPFSYVPLELFDCTGPGKAKHNIDLEREFTRVYKPSRSAVFVDPLNGSDANPGTLESPLKTVKMAVASAAGTVLLKPGRYTERFDIRGTDRPFRWPGSPALIVKAWKGPGTVIFSSPGDQPSGMAWRKNGGIWQATPSGQGLADLILYVGNGGRDTPLQYRASVAEVKSTGNGWHQDPLTKAISIRHENRDLNADKSKFEILYQPRRDALIMGAKVLLKDITFRGGSQISALFQDESRPVLYAKNCVFEYLAGSNIRTNGAICFTQNCTSRRALIGDGFNYNDSESGVPTEALEVDNRCVENGVVECMTYVSNSAYRAPNKQGSSGHDKTRVCRVNGVYERNLGQNIADTGADSHTWMVGSILGDVRVEHTNLWMEGTAYLDSVKAEGAKATHGLWLHDGKTYVRNCEFSGAIARTGGAGVMSDWIDAAPPLFVLPPTQSASGPA